VWRTIRSLWSRIRARRNPVGRIATYVGHFRPDGGIHGKGGAVMMVEPKDPAADIEAFDRVLVDAGTPEYLRPATAYDRLNMTGPAADLGRMTHVLVSAESGGAYRRRGVILEPEHPSAGSGSGTGAGEGRETAL
jgi:hypothetical protein